MRPLPSRAIGQLEVSNALLTSICAPADSRSLTFTPSWIEFDQLTIRVQPAIDLDEIGPLAQFAMTHQLTTYDASYVQLAFHSGAPLATLDRAMRRAASALNIPLLPA